VKQYESGQLNRSDFMGFYMKTGEGFDDAGARRRPKEKQADTALSTIELLTPGAKGERTTMVYFDGFESRQARAPGQRAGRSGSAAVSGAFEEGLAKLPPPKDQVLYSVRWVQARGSGESTKADPKKPQKVEDRRINLSQDLGQPQKSFGGRCGPTTRTFYAMGEQKGV